MGILWKNVKHTFFVIFLNPGYVLSKKKKRFPSLEIFFDYRVEMVDHLGIDDPVKEELEVWINQMNPRWSHDDKRRNSGPYLVDHTYQVPYVKWEFQ